MLSPTRDINLQILSDNGCWKIDAGGDRSWIVTQRSKGELQFIAADRIASNWVRTTLFQPNSPELEVGEFFLRSKPDDLSAVGSSLIRLPKGSDIAAVAIPNLDFRRDPDQVVLDPKWANLLARELFSKSGRALSAEDLKCLPLPSAVLKLDLNPLRPEPFTFYQDARGAFLRCGTINHGTAEDRFAEDLDRIGGGSVPKLNCRGAIKLIPPSTLDIRSSEAPNLTDEFISFAERELKDLPGLKVELL